MSNSVEIWKSVIGYEGIYEVSNHGRIASVKNGERFIRKLNKATVYLSVSLKKRPQDIRQGSANVHKLVADAFLGERPEGHVIRHIDGNRYNNKADNLQYGTANQNVEDSVNHGTYKGAKNGRAVLTEAGVLAIKMLLEKGVSQSEIAKKIGVSIASINAIKQGRNWSHIKN